MKPIFDHENARTKFPCHTCRRPCLASRRKNVIHRHHLTKGNYQGCYTYLPNPVLFLLYINSLFSYNCVYLYFLYIWTNCWTNCWATHWTSCWTRRRIHRTDSQLSYWTPRWTPHWTTFWSKCWTWKYRRNRRGFACRAATPIPAPPVRRFATVQRTASVPNVSCPSVRTMFSSRVAPRPSILLRPYP